MHLRGGDMTTTCAECRVTEHPLPRSAAHDLDARALKARAERAEGGLASAGAQIRALEKAYTNEGLRAEQLEAQIADLATFILDPEEPGKGVWPQGEGAVQVAIRVMRQQRERLMLWECKLEDRERVIAAFRERCQKLEAVATTARVMAESRSKARDVWPGHWLDLRDALAALDAKEVG